MQKRTRLTLGRENPHSRLVRVIAFLLSPRAKEQGDEQRRVHLLLQAIDEAPDRTRPLLSAPQGEFGCLRASCWDKQVIYIFIMI